jgi:uncharacterized membrane protein YhdT
MTTLKNHAGSLEMKWAIGYTLMTLGWALAAKLFGFDDARIRFSQAFNTAILLPSFLFYVLAIRDKRQRSFHGVITFKQAVLSGFKLTLLITLLGPLYPIVATQIISPGFFARSIEFMVASGTMSAADAADQFNLATFIGMGVVGAVLTGGLFSLVAAIAVRGGRNADAPGRYQAPGRTRGTTGAPETS